MLRQVRKKLLLVTSVLSFGTVTAGDNKKITLVVAYGNTDDMLHMLLGFPLCIGALLVLYCCCPLSLCGCAYTTQQTPELMS